MQPQHTQLGERPCVLLVDDDVDLTKVLTQILSSEGLDVQVARDGNQGLLLARNSCPSLMIVDLHMPVIDGIDFVGACRAIPHCADVPIFLATATGDLRSVRSQIEGKGVVLLMPKPFDLDTLIPAVHGAIRSHGNQLLPRLGEKPRATSACS